VLFVSGDLANVPFDAHRTAAAANPITGGKNCPMMSKALFLNAYPVGPADITHRALRLSGASRTVANGCGVRNFPLNLSDFVVGRSWCRCIHVCLHAASLFSSDWRENGEEMHSSSASIYALQTAIN
jgi:hypothetical protein